ncbi:MAG: DNA damage-inducible protein D [Planctomycetota bacterium]|nr:DNA damage-inducible protein D [Planctomycetota bacterium]
MQSLQSGSSDDNQGSPFDVIRHTNQHGVACWTARELQPHLGYTQWRNFAKAVQKARVACEKAGHNPSNHFADVSKMVSTGSKTVRNVDDINLSRFACYLIAMNGDPQKPQIAAAQEYFAVQTRRQELQDEQVRDMERIELRGKVSSEFKLLSGAAKNAGVNSKMFGVFHDAGYRGLYGGLGRKEIKAKKKIPEKDDLLDRVGSTELAANQFRLTQTRDQLQKRGIKNEGQAIELHHRIGKEVRQAIKNIDGEMPENLPSAEHINVVEKRISDSQNIVLLEQADARGLSSPDSDDTVDSL